MDDNPKALLKLARVRRYGSHRVKVSLKSRVRSGLSEGLVLGLLKFDRDLRMATDHWPQDPGLLQPGHEPLLAHSDRAGAARLLQHAAGYSGPYLGGMTWAC